MGIEARGRFQPWFSLGSTLTSLEAGLDLVDHIDPAFAPDEFVGAMAAAQRFQRVSDFHNNPVVRRLAGS
jgi:hypothetical protein